jgi:formylglycine-generating enzyme required for sulfatase activity
LLLGCRSDDGDHAVPTAQAAAEPAPAVVETAAPTATASAAPAPSAACPEDMVLAEGGYCPLVREECLRHTKEWEDEEERRERAKEHGLELPMSRVTERCLQYAETKCLSPARTPLRFCVDRYEWPNEKGAMPAFLVTWTEAKAACDEVGKRLCSPSEFDFACEGERMLPYSYGYERESARCNVDKPYVERRRKLLPYEECMKRPWCKEHLDELDQRAPAGSFERCTSPFGAFDLNGNVNEWVERPGEAAPWRSGLKGGWWGPARSRCRPMVTTHNEEYAGYEVGFRCCKAASD